MTNQYMTKLYHDLLSNSPQTVTIDKARSSCFGLENELFFRYERAGSE